MKQMYPSSHRHISFMDDLGPELPFLVLGAILLVITSLAVYLYAAVQ